MTIGFSELFTRIGHYGGAVNDCLAYQGGTQTTNVLTAAGVVARYNQFVTDAANAPALSYVIDGFYASTTNQQSAQQGYLSQLQKLAQNMLLATAQADGSLTQNTWQNAMAVLVAQMVANTSTVQASTPAAGAQTGVGSPVGTPTIVTSVKNQYGYTAQYLFPETMTFACTLDSNSGATLNQEQYGIAGQATYSQQLNYQWPAGSGTSTAMNGVDSTLNNSGGNTLQNSCFQTFTTPNQPDNWTIVVGSAGTSVLQDTTHAYIGASDLEFVGDGSTLQAVTQQFNVTPTPTVGVGGTAYKVLENTQYAVNLWLKVSATPAAGVLTVSLVNGSGTTINDSASTANSFTISLPSVSTTYLNFKGTFRTPASLPASGVFLKLALTTALSNTKNLYIGQVGMATMTQLYPGGLWARIFSSAVPPVKGDSWTVADTNTYGVFQELFERLFSMRSLGLQLPYSGSPSISDSLVA